MTKTLSLLFVGFLATVATGMAIADKQHHAHRFPKDVDAFHAVLAPIWHAPQGSERLQSACAKAGVMESLAKGIRSRDASGLVSSVETLKTTCQGDQAAVEGALGNVHDAFHQLIDHKPAGKAG
jgi:hypothetical protein